MPFVNDMAPHVAKQEVSRAPNRPFKKTNPVEEFFKFRVSRENTFQFWIYLDDSAKLSRMLLTGDFKQINAKKRAICAILLMEPFLSYIEEYAF